MRLSGLRGITFGREPVVRNGLVAPVVMVTDHVGQVAQSIVHAGYDDSPTGVVREFLKFLVCMRERLTVETMFLGGAN